MNVSKLLRLLRAPGPRPPASRGNTREEQAARKYWDKQIADDRDRRGVTDKHP